MIVLDCSEPVRFTPGELINTPGAPVYLIAPPTMRGRATFRRELAALGAVYPATEMLVAALRDGVRTGLADTDQSAWLALLDRYEDAVAQGAELPDPDRINLAALERDMRQHYPPYAALIADRQFWLDMAPYVAARHFLVGWENVDAPFARTRGLVDEAALEALPPAHVTAIGNRALALMRPDADAEKNSALRPGSPAGRGTSTAASKRSTVRPGTSPATSTGKTRAS